MKINIEEPAESYWKIGTLRDVWEREPVVEERRGRITVYQGYKNYFKMVGVYMLLGGIIGFLAGEATNNYQKARRFDVTPQSALIDQDILPDLVIGERVFLADITEQGVKYHRLSRADLYRIK